MMTIPTTFQIITLTAGKVLRFTVYAEIVFSVYVSSLFCTFLPHYRHFISSSFSTVQNVLILYLAFFYFTITYTD